MIRITYYEETLLTTRYSRQIRWFEFPAIFDLNTSLKIRRILSPFLITTTCIVAPLFPPFHTNCQTICIITCQSISIYFQPNARELQFPMKRHPCHLHGQLAFQAMKSPLNICINQKSHFKNECKAST